MNERVVLLGLDGGEPSRLAPLLAECPNLRRLREAGAWGRLRSTTPPLSPPAWATLMTGVNPGKHGVFDFYHMPIGGDGSYVRRLITSAHWRAAALWDRTSAHGRRAGFFNMPMCWPPPAVEPGFFVCGLGTPPGAAAFTTPPGLGATLPGDLLEPGDGTTMGPDRSAFLARCEASGAAMLETAERLWRAGDLDLFCAALTFPDRFQHVFWRELEAGEARVDAVWRRWFAAFDAFLGRVLDAAGPASAVVLFSDHGFGPVTRYFHVNRWLLRQGWLRLADPGALGGPDGLLRAIDWDATRAYCLSEYGDIRLNLRGREPRGVVAPAEVDATLAALARELEWLDDGAPGPTVDAVIAGARLYHGPFAGEAPDLVVRLRGHAVLCAIDGRGRDLADPAGPLFVAADGPEHYRGAHRSDGVLAAWGDAVRRPAAPLEADAADLAPTVLHCLGLPLDPSFDGRVLREMLAPALAAAPSTYESGIAAAAATDTAYSAADEAEITLQLRQLGYVE